jgi:hypothetical protein
VNNEKGQAKADKPRDIAERTSEFAERIVALVAILITIVKKAKQPVP